MEHITKFIFVKFSDLCRAEYQRPLDLKRVAKFTKNFNLNGVGTPTLSYRDGSYWIVDGQNRIEALEQLYYKGFTCHVIYDLSYEEESALYNVLNDHKAQTPLARFNAKLEAKLPDAVALRDLVLERTLSVADKEGCGGIKCVSTLERWFDINPKNLDTALTILSLSWPGNMHALNHQMIDGTCLFTNHYENKIDTFRLINRLKVYVGGPEAFLVSAKAHPEFSQVSAKVEASLRGQHNYNQKAQNRI